MFQASIALAGFIAIFIVFNYQTLDNRVDHRKDILRSLLRDQIRQAPYIAFIIQNITDKESINPDELCTHINECLTNNSPLPTKTKKAIKKFAGEIYGYKKFRDIIVYFGIACIFIWSILALKYLFIQANGHYLCDRFCYSKIIFFFSIRSFIFSMLLTLAFIIISLIAKAKWFNSNR